MIVHEYIKKKRFPAIEPDQALSIEDDTDALDEDRAPYSTVAREDSGLDLAGEDESQASAELPTLTTPSTQSPQTQQRSPNAPDPMLMDYMSRSKARDIQREGARSAEQTTNMGQALSHLALGVNTPQSMDGFYSNLNAQNKQHEASADADLSRQASVIKAIQANQLGAKKLELGTGIKKQGLTLAGQRLDLTAKHQDEMTGAYKARTEALKQGTGKRQGATNIRAANLLLTNKPITSEVTKINAASGVRTLIDDIKSGKLTDSKNIRNQLTNMMTTIELGGGGGVSDRHNMGVDTLYGNLADFASRIEGKPISSITPEYLEQLSHEADALGDRAVKNYGSLTNSALQGADLSGGDPDADSGQIHQLVKQRRDAYMKENGYDPETGGRIQKASSFPRTVSNGSHTATVSNQQEADQAAAKGFH